MEKIKKKIISLNKNIDINSLTTDQIHILYFFYTASELNKIPPSNFLQSSKLILSFLNEEDIKKIIKTNEQEQIKESQETEEDDNSTNSKNNSTKNFLKKKLDLSQVELVAKLKEASLIQKKWLIEYLLQIKDKTFATDHLEKQKKKLTNLLEERKKNINLFNQYLRKGKKTAELLQTNYFANFKKEVNEIIDLLQPKKIINQEEFFENYYHNKGPEESKIEELTFLRMLYDTTEDNHLKKITYQAHSNFPEIDLEKIKNSFLQKILSK